MTILARKYIRIGYLISLIFVVSVFFIDEKVNLILGLIWAGASFWVICFTTNRDRRYYTPLFVAIFYLFGYLIAFAILLLNKNTSLIAGNYIDSFFSFTSAQVFSIISITITGVFAVIFATLVFEKFFSKTQIKKDNNYLKLSMNTIYLWFFLSCALLVVMWVLGVGRGGLQNSTLLPFRLAGIMVYARNFLVPFVGTFFFGIYMCNNPRLALHIFRLIVCLGILATVTSLSKSIFIFYCAPTVLFVFFTLGRKEWLYRVFLRYSLLTLVLFSFLIVFLETLRTLGYHNQNINLISQLSLLEFSDMKTGFLRILTLSISRIIGLKELILINSSTLFDSKGPLMVFFENTEYINSVLLDVFNIIPQNDGFTSTGIGFGLWGMLYLGGSLLMVFGGTFLLYLFPLFVEEVFLRENEKILSLFFSVQLGLWFFGGVNMSFLFRTSIMLFLCYLTMRFLKRGYQLRK
jgi:hypothetical protein